MQTIGNLVQQLPTPPPSGIGQQTKQPQPPKLQSKSKLQTSIRYSEEIQRIFKSFAGNYRQLWLGGIPTQEALSLVAEDWQEALAKFDAEEIEQGRKNWIYNNRMPPTIFEFKELLLRLKERLKTINSVPYPHDYNDDINGGVMTKKLHLLAQSLCIAR